MAGVDFSDAINLSSSSLYSSSPQVAVLDRHVYVVWHESSGIYGPQRQTSGASEPVEQKSAILYRVSHDNGSSFEEARQLHAFQNLMSFPARIGVSPKTKKAIIAWTDLTYNGQYYSAGIFFASSKEGGQFETPRRLDGNQTLDNSSKTVDFTRNRSVSVPSPCISISGENVYVMWLGVKDLLAGRHRGEYGMHDIDFECDVLFRASHDAGDHFTSAVSLGSFRVRGTHPGGGHLGSIGPLSVKAKNNNVYAVWHQLGSGPLAGAVLFRKSVDGGKSFSSPIALNRMYRPSNEAAYGRDGNADVTVYLCDIEIDEDDARDKDELFAAWLVQERSADENNLLASFRLRPFNMKYTMYFAKLASGDNNNIIFPTYAKITDSAWGGIDSFIRVSGDNVYAFWNDTNTGEITVRSSRDGGFTFGPPSGIKGTDPASRNSTNLPVGPFVLAQNNMVFVAWHGHLAKNDNDSPRVVKPGSGPREYHLPRTVIAFSASADNGATFSNPVIISRKDSWRPAGIHFAISNRHIYSACSEGKEWSPDIFFRVGCIPPD